MPRSQVRVTIALEIHSWMGALVDGRFNFIAIDRP
jgi:hypothetical protein